MNKNSLNKEVVMEYKIHKCCDKKCDCFEISRVIDRIKVLSFYQVYNVAKEAYIFSFSYIRNCFEGRIYRRTKRFIYKSLPPNIDHSSDTQGIPQCWTQAPPKRNTFRIFHKITNEHQMILKFKKFLVVYGVRGVNNAPPSARERVKNVHQLVQRENQTESFAV